MKRSTYVRMLEYWEASPARRRAVIWMCRGCPLAVVALYAGAGAYLAFHEPKKLLVYLGVPALGFVLVSVLRARLNWQRPFEMLAFEPLLTHSAGKSFPSRHTASAFLIAMACWCVYPWLGAAALLLAVAVGVSRVLTGLHYPRDVLAGMGIGVGLGSLSFLFMPLFS